MPSLFLSHASDDSELVDQFVQCIFRLGSNLNPDQFFYSSGADSRVPIGQPGNPYIRDRAREAELVICVVTPAYAASHYCIAELGAAWASAHEGALFPLILPTMRHSDLEGVLQGVEIRSLDDRAALNELHQRLGEATDITSSTTTWEKGREQWLESLPGLMDVSSDVKPSLSRGDTQSDSWGRLYDTLVDAALYKESEQTARNAILQHIETDTVISSRFHYSHDACAANWISRCKDPQYQHQRHTTEFWSGAASKKYVAQVRDLVAGQLFDFVSLGPGDGQKDADLVSNWLDDGVDLVYYPYDVSFPLAAHAVRAVQRRAIARGFADRLRIKAVLADFEHLDQVRQVFQHRSTPNVVGLFGTLGNLRGDLDFLHRLSQVMDEGDLLLLEVRLDPNTSLERLVSKNSLRHDFGPLEHHLGMTFDRSSVRAKYDMEGSSIPNTKTIVVTYEGPVPGHESKEVVLQYIHLYDPDAFITAVSGNGFEYIDSVVEHKKAFLEVMLRRV